MLRYDFAKHDRVIESHIIGLVCNTEGKSKQIDKFIYTM